MKTLTKTVLIAGAQGVIGRAAAEHFSKDADTPVHAVSRRPVVGLENVHPISADLLDPADTRTKLEALIDVTHVIFGAYVEKDTPAERSSVNVALLSNLMDAVEESAPNLQHVTIYQGGKAYGADLGPFKTPAREDDPRLMSPNFYYDQEDHLRQRQQGKRWTFSILRPEAVCGYAVGNPMNLLTVIAVYAAISKELGLPLRFPGTEAAYRALYQITSADILARATALGRARQKRRKTKSSISPMVITSAGNSCGRASPGCSRWTLPNPCRCPWPSIWLTRATSGQK
jgi:nucleoside-diphosphate-sugar epimerase